MTNEKKSKQGTKTYAKHNHPKNPPSGIFAPPDPRCRNRRRQEVLWRSVPPRLIESRVLQAEPLRFSLTQNDITENSDQQ